MQDKFLDEMGKERSELERAAKDVLISDKVVPYTNKPKLMFWDRSRIRVYDKIR